jgi:uncharacterized protein YndB with AHSA1/START domain
MWLPNETDIAISREFAAPARLVFAALTTPKQVRRWWAPRSRGTIVSVEIDLRMGGAWRFVMRAAGGVEVGLSGRYLELDSPIRIVHTEVFDALQDTLSMVPVAYLASSSNDAVNGALRLSRLGSQR